MGTTDAPPVAERGPLTTITRGIVRLHAEYFGKGPTRARTERIGGDFVICILRDTLTPVERTLVDRGQADQVISLRRSFQDVMAPEFPSVVENSVGRRVLAFLSQVHLEPDIAVEMFFLENSAVTRPGGGGRDGAGPDTS